MIIPVEVAAFNHLFRTGFKHDPACGFILASGKPSDIYVDCKPMMLSAYGIRDLGHLLFERIRTAWYINKAMPRPIAVAGVVMGGIPLATAVSLTSLDHGEMMHMDSILIRKEAKAHGTGKLIEMPPRQDDARETVIVEDVVTTGASSIDSIRKLRDEGLNPVGVFAIVDRQEGGSQAIVDHGVYFNSLFTRDDLMKEWRWLHDDP